MNDITLLTIISASFTFTIVLLRLLFKSKCSYFRLGCIEVKRNVDIEEKEHEFDIEHNIKDKDLEIIKNSIK
jgi:hypothetical protein